MSTDADRPLDAHPERPRKPLPVDTAGIITAITVLLEFFLLFVRYSDFEFPGAWNITSVIAAVLVALAIVFEIIPSMEVAAGQGR